MPDISFSATMDEKDVQRALQNMVKENAKLRAEIGLGVQESKAAATQEREWQKLREKATKEATQQMAQLNSAAQRIKDSVASPFEEAKKKAAELRDHLQAGRITVDEYRLAYAKVAKEMKEATRDHAAEAEAAKAAAAAKADAARKAAEAERDHAQAMREASAIADKYATKEERVAAELKRLNALKERGVLSSKDYARAVEAEQKKLTETGEAADKSGGLIGGLTSKMGTFVSGLSASAAVIATIKSEYDALIERQGKAKDVNLSLAAEQEALLMNLGGADAGAVAKNINTLSRKSGIKEENVTRAVNEAMAARGDLGVDSVVNAVGSVSKIRKFAPSEMAGLAAATIDTQKQTGLSTDESLGFLLQMQGQSRTKNLKGLAENFTPAVGGVMNFGASRQEAGAMLAALSHGMGDTSGAMTSTSAIQLAKQLREYGRGGGPELQAKLAELEKTHAGQTTALSADFDKRAIALNAQEMPSEKKAELRRQLAAEERERKQALKERQAVEVDNATAGVQAVPIGQVLARMQQDPAYREQFLRGKDQGGFGASFEAKALPAIESLLSGGTQARQFEAAKSALSQDPMIALADAIKARGASQAIGLAETDQLAGNKANQIRIGDKSAAESAVVRQQLDDFRAAMGDGYFTRRLKGVFDDAQTGGTQTYESAIRSIQADIGEKQKSINYRSNLAPGGDREFKNNPAMAAAQQRDEEMVKAMREMIELLKEQRDLQQQNNADNAAKNHAGNVAARAAQEGG